MDFNSKHKSSEIEEILDSVGDKQDKLVSGTNIKTVNGESILGEGNIEISSSMPLYEQGSTNSISVYPNVYTRFQYSIYSLTIYLNPGYEIEGQLNEYLIEFQVGANDATISFPDTVIWENGIYPTFEANCTYQISIVNNLGVVKKFGI